MTISSSFCSAGIGRSGTFCLVDCCLVLIDKEGENRVSVQEVLLELRNYRMGLIQTHDQLTFSYEAIIEGMKRMNNDVSCVCNVGDLWCSSLLSLLDIQRVGQFGNCNGQRSRRGGLLAAATTATDDVQQPDASDFARYAARFGGNLRAERSNVVGCVRPSR